MYSCHKQAEGAGEEDREAQEKGEKIWWFGSEMSPKAYTKVNVWNVWNQREEMETLGSGDY